MKSILDSIRVVELTEALVKDGAIPQASPSPDEMRRFVESEIVRWGKVVEQAGLKGSE